VAGLIPPHLLEQIRAANDIVDVIGSYLPLKRAGGNFRALCPFHREKSPSFNVNPHHQIFKCFGCGKGGDVFTFVKEYEGIQFMDAVRRLAERAKITLEFENNPAAQQARHIKDVLLQIHEQITTRWQSALANEAGGEIARDYLKKRGVSPDAVKLFRLGYAPDAWDDTVNWAKSKAHDFATVAQAGLIIQKEGTDRYYDRFRGRLIFPICDDQGRVIGFSGRVLSGDEKTAKYVNSPETPIFTKGRVFFGLDKSKRPLLDSQTAIICEGQLDLISCYMGGVQNVVAPQGTALTPDHARILKRYVEEVVLCFDADNAGQNAVVRSLDALLAAGLAIRVASVPNGKDPDEFIKTQGGDAFREVISGAEGFFDWYLKRLSAVNDTRSDKGRLTVIREFGEALLKTNNAVLIDTYAQKTALRLGVAPDSVRAEFKKHRPAAPTRADDEPPLDAIDETPLAPPSAQELQLLKILLAHDDLMHIASEHLQLDWIVHPVVQRIITRKLSDAPPSSTAMLASLHDDPASQSLLTEVLADEHAVPEPEKQIVDVLKHLRDDALTRELEQLRRSLAHPEITDEQRLQMLQRQQAIRLQKQRPLVELNSP
jgi:DNA primase